MLGSPSVGHLRSTAGTRTRGASSTRPPPRASLLLDPERAPRARGVGDLLLAGVVGRARVQHVIAGRQPLPEPPGPLGRPGRLEEHARLAAVTLARKAQVALELPAAVAGALRLHRHVDAHDLVVVLREPARETRLGRLRAQPVVLD